MAKGMRLFSVLWSMKTTPSGVSFDTSIEAAHSRRFLYDQIKKGEVRDGQTKYYKIQELETPMIDLDFFQELLHGEYTTSRQALKKIDEHRDQADYICQLIRCMAARYSEGKKVIER